MNHGGTWIGTGADPAGSVIGSGAFSPALAVAGGGDVYIANAPDAGHAITVLVSRDGGDSFNAVPSPATGITTLEASLPPWKPNGWPVLPGGTFRVFTIPTICVFGTTVIVAWADYREGVSRLYYARSTDAGTTWSTAAAGQPLITASIPSDFQHFHPQLAVDPHGVIGCAFYEYGPKREKPRIDMILAASHDGGARIRQVMQSGRGTGRTRSRRRGPHYVRSEYTLVDPRALVERPGPNGGEVYRTSFWKAENDGLSVPENVISPDCQFPRCGSSLSRNQISMSIRGFRRAIATACVR